MQLTDGEKLIIKMLAELYKHFELKGEIDADFVSSAIHTGNTWGLRWKYTGIFDAEEADPFIVKEVIDILDMWSFIERSFGNFSVGEKERVKSSVLPYSFPPLFNGFDGNNETIHLNVAHFLIHDLERFSIFKNRELNSHSPSLEVYARMYNVFGPMRASLIVGLSADQMIEIINARTHPSRSNINLIDSNEK